ncbi:hypothetical protein PENSOL_c036G00598 [Penicillium solitum]|uniref:Uncharacterized protein n=1 Tax=Penicillium solitum TaxID=60172 RepID=A0A1V6QVF0_9EURO|nr:uncharacterized protein PENSOL_c036G00598 [Penicillium solitum]OQD92906.1 hypothetical protein PENSOL_c036G00598 [Penicillium solitum]
MYSREAICKPHARGTRRRGCCRTTASSQDSADHETKELEIGQTPPVHDAFDHPPPPSAANTDLLLTSPTQEPMFPQGNEPSSVAKPDTAYKKPLESRLPVRTAFPTTTALKVVLLRSRASLNDEEKKHGEKAAPESNEILRVKDKVDTLKIKLEDVKWEYERTKAEFEAHEQERVEFRTRHRS